MLDHQISQEFLAADVHPKNKQKVSPQNRDQCVAVVPPHRCKCLACPQRWICGRADMMSIWGLAAGPHIWPWPLAGQPGSYNLGSHSPLWPGERTHTYTHRTQRQHNTQHQPHEWEQSSMETPTNDSKQNMQLWEDWGATHTHEPHMHLCVSTHQKYTCTLQNMTAVYVADLQGLSACEKESRGSKDSLRAGRGEETVWKISVLTLHFSLIHHLKQKGHWSWDETRAEQGRAEQRVVTPACMKTTFDMLTLPTRSSVGHWSISCFEMELVQPCSWHNDSLHIILGCVFCMFYSVQ